MLTIKDFLVCKYFLFPRGTGRWGERIAQGIPRTTIGETYVL